MYRCCGRWMPPTRYEYTLASLSFLEGVPGLKEIWEGFAVWLNSSCENPLNMAEADNPIPLVQLFVSAYSNHHSIIL